jgi:hypothetical protein
MNAHAVGRVIANPSKRDCFANDGDNNAAVAVSAVATVDIVGSALATAAVAACANGDAYECKVS